MRSAKYPCHLEDQIQLLVQRNLTDKSAKLGEISVSPYSFIMPAQISHYFYDAVPYPWHLLNVKCNVSLVVHLSSKVCPRVGNLSFMNFLFSATLNKENQNKVLLRFSISELCVLKYYLPLLNTNQGRGICTPIYALQLSFCINYISMQYCQQSYYPLIFINCPVRIKL